MGAQMNGSQEQEFEQYIHEQLDEIQSDLNKWGAGEQFGHDPDHNELVIHYIQIGAAQRYAERKRRT